VKQHEAPAKWNRRSRQLSLNISIAALRPLIAMTLPPG
jgi:hypothetical protein